MSGIDFSTVLAAARNVPGPHVEGEWRCAVYLSAFDWLSGWRAPADMSRQSLACREWLATHSDLRRVKTVRNRSAFRNVRAPFEELMAAVENRIVECVVVPDIAVFATCFSEARFNVEEVLIPMGFRFIDCARKFDSLHGDVLTYLEDVGRQFNDERQLRSECTRLREGKMLRSRVPYGYVFDDGGVLVDEGVARFVPQIFELASRERWWCSLIEGQVNALGAPGLRQRRNELYGFHRHAGRRWDMGSIRRLVTNPFYTGDYIPSELASKRMRESGIDLADFAVIENHHPALVDRDLFAAANEGLRRNKRACPTEAEGRKPYRGKEI